MKLDPGIHIGIHLVCFFKTRCDMGLAPPATNVSTAVPGDKTT
jgi:hypothetical protein